MPKKSPFTDKELKFFRELQKRKVPFLIVGLSAAVIQGAPVSTQDVDIWIEDLSNPEFLKAVKSVGATYVPPIKLHPPLLVGKNLEFIDLVVNVHGINPFKEEYKRSKKLRLGNLTVRILPIARIIKSKEHLNRPKDRAVLPVLRDVWKALKTPRRK